VEKNQRRARVLTRWGLALIATAIVAAPIAQAADTDGWYPAPPTPLRVDGELTRIWAGSVTDKEYTTVGLNWLQAALLRYQWVPLDEQGSGGQRMAAKVATVVRSLGYEPASVGTPRIASGESAELAAVLSVIDAQTPGSLTRGINVVATGQVSPDGRVVPIGGADSKANGAARAGFTVMLVPEANSADVGVHGQLTVYPVHSVKHALRVLCSLGASDGACVNK